jgi:Sulfotransferase domain
LTAEPVDPVLALVHIPRTGGGTVSSAISKNYATLKSAGNYQKGPEKTRAALENIRSKAGVWRAVGDHVPYGLYLRYLSPDTRYMTILRDPVDRVLSHYHFHAQSGRPPGEGGRRKLRNVWAHLLNSERVERQGNEGEPIVIPDDLNPTLEEGFRRKIVIYDNFMTRFLWGGETLFGDLPPDALERAKENISNFWFVGVRERLDESIILLGRKLGVGLMPYNLRHVSQKRPPLDETSAELRGLVAESNALDVELYRFARERFDAEAPAPGELDQEVQELRRRSIEITEAAQAVRAASKEEGKARRKGKRAERRGRGGESEGRGRKRAGTKADRKAARASRSKVARVSGDQAGGPDGPADKARAGSGTGVKKLKTKTEAPRLAGDETDVGATAPADPNGATDPTD